MHWFYLGLAIMAEVVATTTLKATENFTRLWPSLIVVLGYGASFYCMSLTLNKIPIGITYAVWSGVGVSLVALVAWLRYGQQLDWPALVGIGLIVSGVVVIQLFSKAEA